MTDSQTINLPDMKDTDEPDEPEGPRQLVEGLGGQVGDIVKLELVRGVVEGTILTWNDVGLVLEVEAGNSAPRVGEQQDRYWQPEMYPWRAVVRVQFVELRTSEMIARGRFDPYFYPESVVAAAEAQTAAEIAAEEQAESVPVVPPLVAKN